jgi:hypothetical protein
MKISPKAKKIIFISSGSILAVAVLIWYFSPFLLANYVWYKSGVRFQNLKIKPIPVIALKAPPKEWKNITIDNLTMKLPMLKYTKVCGEENFIRFISGKECLLVSEIVPSKETLQMIKENKLTYPYPSFRYYSASLSSTPADISFFNSQRKNMTASIHQSTKAIIMPGGVIKILTVNAGTLKALCIISEKRDKGYTASVSVYSQNENVSLDLFLTHYEDQTTLEADLLAILSGIKMPDRMGDYDRVSKDINRLVTQYKKP